MRPAELEALIGQGPEALKAVLARAREQQFLSEEERQLVERALSRMSAEAPTEEPEDLPKDSEPEPKAEEDETPRRSIPRRSAGKKG